MRTARATAMRVRFTKQASGSTEDTVEWRARDGATTALALPRSGVIPLLAIQWVVEQSLGWKDGFFGASARGERPGAEARQSAALAECLQAGQWAGAADPAAFARLLRAACRRHGVPPPVIAPGALAALQVKLREFGAAWRPLAPGRSLEFALEVV